MASIIDKGRALYSPAGLQAYANLQEKMIPGDKEMTIEVARVLHPNVKSLDGWEETNKKAFNDAGINKQPFENIMRTNPVAARESFDIYLKDPQKYGQNLSYLSQCMKANPALQDRILSIMKDKPDSLKQTFSDFETASKDQESTKKWIAGIIGPTPAAAKQPQEPDGKGPPAEKAVSSSPQPGAGGPPAGKRQPAGASPAREAPVASAPAAVTAPIDEASNEVVVPPPPKTPFVLPESAKESSGMDMIMGFFKNIMNGDGLKGLFEGDGGSMGGSLKDLAKMVGLDGLFDGVKNTAIGSLMKSFGFGEPGIPHAGMRGEKDLIAGMLKNPDNYAYIEGKIAGVRGILDAAANDKTMSEKDRQLFLAREPQFLEAAGFSKNQIKDVMEKHGTPKFIACKDAEGKQAYRLQVDFPTQNIPPAIVAAPGAGAPMQVQISRNAPNDPEFEQKVQRKVAGSDVMDPSMRPV